MNADKETPNASIERQDSQQILASMWRESVTLMQERIIKTKDVIEQKSEHLYYILSGKVAIGKKIVDENEFIQGKEGRSFTALQKTSVLTIEISMERRT